jgi:hypothetical protein
MIAAASATAPFSWLAVFMGGKGRQIARLGCFILSLQEHTSFYTINMSLLCNERKTDQQIEFFYPLWLFLVF